LSSAARQKQAQTGNRRATNLTIDPEALVRGEAFSRLHGTSLSQLVSDLLRALPAADYEPDRESLSPVVRRLTELRPKAKVDKSDYRAHLLKKYGG
jgi:hypothetical protein